MKDYQFCIIATSGDCSQGAMSKRAEKIPIRNKYFSIVEEFLICQTAYRIKEQVLIKKDFNFDKAFNSLYMAYNKKQRKMFRACIFTNKYQARSHWELCINEEPFLKETGINHKTMNYDRKKFYDKIENSKSFTALHVSEKFGSDLNADDVIKHDVWGKYLFLQCTENSIYDNASNEISVFAIKLDSIEGEVMTEYSVNNFRWNDLDSYVQYFEDDYEVLK
jgi:hypothetical protein